MIRHIADLVAKAHGQSAKSGFWNHDEDCPPPHPARISEKCTCVNLDLAMKRSLIRSEISEALEEYRLTDEKRGGSLGAILYSTSNVGKTHDASLLPARLDGEGIYLACGLCRNGQNVTPPDAVHAHKPEGFIVELADAAIRLFDLAGFLKLELHSISQELAEGGLAGTSWGGLFELLYDGAGGVHPDRGTGTHDELLALLEYAARRAGGDLWQAIEIKMAYNATRPFKHGKVC